MADNRRSQRLTLAKLTPPEWFGWSGVCVMFLLLAARVPVGGGRFYFPLLSLGEWLLLPLGALSLTMGFLALARIRERTLLPLWISAIVPAVLWLAVAGVSVLVNGEGGAAGDLLLSWSVRLIFPTMAFLPLLTLRVWRNRLMWALFAGVLVNAVAVFMEGRVVLAGGVGPDYLALGGFLLDQYDFALYLAVALPLLASWRGGVREGGGKLQGLLCTFLLPVVGLMACYSMAGLAGAAIGLAVAWAAWRNYAWLTGIFVCLLVFGYGGERTRGKDEEFRRTVAESVLLGRSNYERALESFVERPYLGMGPEKFAAPVEVGHVDVVARRPGSGLAVGKAERTPVAEGAGSEALVDEALSDDLAVGALPSSAVLLANEAYNEEAKQGEVEAVPGAGESAREVPGTDPSPWYGTLLGGTGLVGIGLWIVMLAELAVRTMGRYGRRCLFPGGVLGATFGLGIVSLWVDALPQGSGALVGFLLALSILDEPESEAPTPTKRGNRRSRVRLKARAQAAAGMVAEAITGSGKGRKKGAVPEVGAGVKVEPESEGAAAAPSGGGKGRDTDIIPRPEPKL